jgi:lactoylglutathione lyase
LTAKFIYTGIHVSNLEKSIEFYTTALGMRLLFQTRIKETGGRVAWLTSRGSKQILELNWYPRKYKYGGKSGLDHLAFEVRDAAKEYRTLSKRYRGRIAPFKEGRWMLAYIEDPDGNWIELASKPRKKKN